MLPTSTNFLFELELRNQTVTAQSISGIERDIDTETWSETTQDTKHQLSSHLSASDIEISYVPIWVSPTDTTTPRISAKWKTFIPQISAYLPPVGNFLFTVLVAGFPVMHVRSVSGIGVEWDVEEWQPTTSLAPAKLASHQNFTQVTLSQVMKGSDKLTDMVSEALGVNKMVGSVTEAMGLKTAPSPFDQFYDWLTQKGDWSAGGVRPAVVSGNKPPGEKDIAIWLFARAQVSERTSVTPAMWVPVAIWRLERCFPVNYNIGDLDAERDEVLLRNLTVQPQNIELVYDGFKAPFYEWVDTIYDKPELETLVVRAYERTGGLLGNRLLSAKEVLNTFNLSTPSHSYKFYNVWPRRLSFGDLDASSNDVFIKTLTCSVEGWERI